MDAWVVQPHLYSGREDPKWELGPNSVEEFLNYLSGCPADKDLPLLDSALGYRGVTVQHGGDSWQVFNGKIVHDDKGVKKICRDEERQVERFLLSSRPDSISMPKWASI